MNRGDQIADQSERVNDRQITVAPRGHILTNTNVWSPNGRLVTYDTRSDPAGSTFDGRAIETVDVDSGEVRVAYDRALCGVVTFDPGAARVAFIRGPVNPTPDWSYSATHREGVAVDLGHPNQIVPIDARDLIPPFTPGALRGGSHVHIFSPDSKLVSFTYEDALLERLDDAAAHGRRGTPSHDRNTRAVGVTLLDHPVPVPAGDHNQDGAGFSVLVTALVDDPADGSDQISRAREEAWVGARGYLRPDGSRQQYALAFQGRVFSKAGTDVDEVFIVDLPDDLTRAGDGPLQGTPTRRPFPPAGCRQRRLTHTTDREHPGIQGPRHWLRSSPDGSAIAFLLRDDLGIAQLFTVSPDGGPIRQITRGPHGIDSAFTWSPDGRRVAAVVDRSVATIDIATGRVDRLTRRSPGDDAPRPEACVFSPDGSAIAYVRRVLTDGIPCNQIFVVGVPNFTESR